jgi:hypothetical protein
LASFLARAGKETSHTIDSSDKMRVMSRAHFESNSTSRPKTTRPKKLLNGRNKFIRFERPTIITKRSHQCLSRHPHPAHPSRADLS